MTQITGRTRIFGIIADPIHHVKTPQVFNAFLQKHGVDGVLVPIHVVPEGLGDMLAGLRRMQNFGGFIVGDFAAQAGDFRRDVGAWLKDGRIKYKEDVVEGLENAPEAFLGLLKGRNFGKLIVKVAD